MDRILHVKGAANVRDLGGYVSQSGEKSAKVRYQKVIRSAGIQDLTPADQTLLAEYGVTKVVDFRSAKERSAAPDAEIVQAENIFLPIFPEQTTTSAAPGTLFEQIQAGLDAATQMRSVYRHFVEEAYSRQAYRRFFEILLANEAPDSGVLFHCTAGKDRTGFGAALVLAGLEVDRQTILDNYLETNPNLTQTLQQMLDQAQKEGAPDHLLAGIKDLMAARADYLGESYAAIQEHYGDVAGFFHEGLGLSHQDLLDFRRLYRE
ncbi:tyrosine-protein phosphatase [Enterococcus asini]|uniref:tyrosine-protein phosphatase n=1 Tax=Enterococcus asini TaxID=57732 RepID=UPI0026DBC1FE|nr:tyrosine-protein phosphatase [Enterococcus asini]